MARLSYEQRVRYFEEQEEILANLKRHKGVVRRCFHCLVKMVYDPVLDCWDCAVCGWRGIDEYFLERQGHGNVGIT